MRDFRRLERFAQVEAVVAAKAAQLADVLVNEVTGRGQRGTAGVEIGDAVPHVEILVMRHVKLAVLGIHLVPPEIERNHPGNLHRKLGDAGYDVGIA